MAEFDGTYTRTKGQKLTYSYSATYSMHNGVLHWSALVNHGGELKGHPNGTVVLAMQSPEIEQRTAGQCIDGAIEDLVGVNE